MRPPSVSLFFFAAAAAILIYGAISVRAPATAPHAPVADQYAIAPFAADNLPAAPDFNWRFNALDPGTAETSATAALFDPADDYWGLPREDGVDLVAGYCSACHSLRIVMQQHANETRWRELMDWMIEKQGMAPPPDEDLEQIVRYLSDHFGV